MTFCTVSVSRRISRGRHFAARSIHEHFTEFAVVEKFLHLRAAVIECDRMNRPIEIVTALERQPDRHELQPLRSPLSPRHLKVDERRVAQVAISLFAWRTSCGLA